LVVGPFVLAVGMVLLLRVSPGASYLGAVLPAVVVFGLGLATVVAPVTATVLAAAPDEHVGVASGVNNAIARAGNLLAIAVLPAIAGLTGESYSNPAALTSGWRISLCVCAGLAIVGGVLALGVRNDVLAPKDVAAQEEPEFRNCLHCAVEAPPTHVRG
jgi:MFS family permease